jgi:hypothetical protein
LVDHVITHLPVRQWVLTVRIPAGLHGNWMDRALTPVNTAGLHLGKASTVHDIPGVR